MSELLIELIGSLAEPIFRGLLYGVAYCIGWFVLSMITAGTLPMASILDGSRGETWCALTMVRNGKRYVLSSVVAMVGLLTIVFVAIEAYMLYHGA